jgi:hypothetical protein
MNARELAEATTEAIEAGDFEALSSYVSDDFQVIGPMLPEPLNLQQWIGQMQSMRAAASDLSFNFRVVEADENSARVGSRLTGTHTGDLDLTSMGMGVIPPTGKSFSTNEEFSMGTVEGGRVTRIELEQRPDSGLAHMLQQIGVELPE